MANIELAPMPQINNTNVHDGERAICGSNDDEQYIPGSTRNTVGNDMNTAGEEREIHRI